MSQPEYGGALSGFLRRKGVTRSPTACVAPTAATMGEADRAAWRDQEAAHEASHLEKLSAFREALPVLSVAL
jgi:hypothetical protein